MREKRTKENRAGMTLVEVMVALGIFALIGGGATSLFVYGLRSNAIVWEQLATQHDGRLALKEVTDTVRRAEDSSLGGYAIVTSTPYALTIYANIDDDAFRERIRFWLDGAILRRGVVKPGGTPLEYNSNTEVVTELAHDVVNITKGVPVFLYYNEAYTGAQSALSQPVNMTEIRLVKIQLELEEDPTATPIPLHVESMVQIRSLKTN